MPPSEDLDKIWRIPLIFSAMESPCDMTTDALMCSFWCPAGAPLAEPSLVGLLRVASGCDSLNLSLKSWSGVCPFLFTMIGLALTSARYFTIR